MELTNKGIAANHLVYCNPFDFGRRQVLITCRLSVINVENR